MSSITWQDKYAPEDAKFHRGVREIREIRQQYYKLKGQIPDSIAYTFANVKQDTTIVLSHSKRMTVWNDVSDNYYPLVQESIEDETYDALFELKENAIGYIRLPDMLDAEEAPKLFDLLTTKMEDFKETKALVIERTRIHI